MRCSCMYICVYVCGLEHPCCLVGLKVLGYGVTPWE